MKTLNRHIFVGILALALAGLSACIKEQPDPTVSPSEISLSLQENTEVKQYAGETSTFYFSIKVPDPAKSSITFSTTGPGEVELDKSILAGSGKLSVTLDKEAASDVNVVITLSCSNASKKYTVTVTPYFFRGEIKTVVLGPDATSRAGVEYTVDTNLDSYQASLELSDNMYFVLEGEEVVALRGNLSGEERTCIIFLKESSGMFKNIYGTVCQSTLPPLPPEQIVHFQDVIFKNAMLELCDVNLDGEVSLDEALTVKEIDIKGKGVTRLDGIEAFKNVWKLDAQNNDIKDGTLLKELHGLYWLDLKGNKKLETFDVTSCTVYFEHCEFEVTEDLVYYTTRQQIQVTNVSDRKCLHSRHVEDTRKTVDWSDQDELVLLRGHKKGRGYPVFFSGLSYLDEDMRDGSFMRLMRDCLKYLLQYDAILEEYSPYIDFYAVKHKAVDRNQYFVSSEHCELGDPFMEAQVTKVNRDHAALFEKMYGVLADNPAEVNRVFPKFIEVNPLGHPGRFASANYGVGVLSDKGWITVQFLHTSMDDEDERWFGGSWSQGVEENCRIHAESNNNEKAFPTYRDFFEENVVN